jgi:predicted RND superfamily exporter protein
MSGRGLLPRRLPLALVRFGGRHPRSVTAAALLAWIVAALLALRLDVETDILSLVPRDNQVVRAFTTTIERFGTVDTLLVVVRIDPHAELEPALAFADELADVLQSWELIDWVQHKVERDRATAAPLLDRATLFLDPAELDSLVERLDRDLVSAEADRLHAALLTPQSLVTKELLRMDPMGLLATVFSQVRLGGAGLSVDPGTGYLIDGDRELLLMLARPVRPAQDLEFSRELAHGLRLRVAEAAAAWSDRGWAGPAPAVEFTGGYLIVVEDSGLITDDALMGMVTSLVGVLVLFLIAFRRPATLAFAALPLVTGLGLSVVFVSLALGRLNSLTSASGALLIGLGIDFIIVLYARYVEERSRGSGHGEALDAIGRHTGLGVLLGAVTTAATFFAFLITDFVGLSELGLLTGTGILLLVVSVFLLLPALLTLLYEHRGRPPKLSLHSFGSDILFRWSAGHPGLTMAAAVLVTVGLAAAISGLEFDDDMRNMRSADNRADRLRNQVMEAFGLRFTPIMLRIDGTSEEEAMVRARSVLPELEALVEDGVLASIDTIAGIVPPLEDQLAVIAKLRHERERLEGVEPRFSHALRAAGVNPEAFAIGIDHLGRALRVDSPLTLADLRDTALKPVVERYAAPYDGGVSTVIYCYPPAERSRRRVPPPLRELADAHDWAVLASAVVVSEELRRIVWGDAARAAVIGMVAVFLLMWADLASPLKAALALVPLAVGMTWMLGVMAVLGLRVNFMNIFVLTMVIGIGVDYGVHLLHRWFESGGDPDALSATARAIAVAALTTMVGFGSIALSHFPGLRSVGVAAILGAACTAIASITVLPVLLAYVTRDR